jgi:hypothetical protein
MACPQASSIEEEDKETSDPGDAEWKEGGANGKKAKSKIGASKATGKGKATTPAKAVASITSFFTAVSPRGTPGGDGKPKASPTEGGTSSCQEGSKNKTTDSEPAVEQAGEGSERRNLLADLDKASSSPEAAPNSTGSQGEEKANVTLSTPSGPKGAIDDAEPLTPGQPPASKRKGAHQAKVDTPRGTRSPTTSPTKPPSKKKKRSDSGNMSSGSEGRGEH